MLDKKGGFPPIRYIKGNKEMSDKKEKEFTAPLNTISIADILKKRLEKK
jgi:hypothetical protein